MQEPSEQHSGGDARPPILGSWRNVYILLASVLAAEIIAMYLITAHFA